MRSSIWLAIEASAQRLLARRETLLAIVSFGASSVYWLALAFLLPAASYGKMMTLQASVLLITTIFACRTFDLLFYLVSKLRYSVQASFRVAALCETVSILMATMVAAFGMLVIGPHEFGLPRADGVIALALLSSIATAQGASMGRLRYLARVDLIARADYVTIACWMIAGASLLFARNQPSIMMLIVGTLPTVVRTAMLAWGAIASRPVASGEAYRKRDLGDILKFLAGGQVMNFAKNSGVSIETMLLAAFCPPASVAMYRLARSTLGATTAAANISFQQGYAGLAHSGTAERKRKIWNRMQREGTLIWAALYPLSAAFGLVYALTKPDIDVLSLQLVTAGAVVAFLPAVLQQGPIAVLSLEGAHRKVNTGFGVGMVALALSSCAMFVVPSVATFLAALIASSFARLAYLMWKAKPYIRNAGPTHTDHIQ